MGHGSISHQKTALSRAKARLRMFNKSEEGFSTIEAGLWTPLLVGFMTFSMNMSMVFFQEAQILDTVQLAMREWSLGRYVDETEVEAALAAQLAYLDADLIIDVVPSPSYLSATVTFSAGDMMPLNFMSFPFDNLLIDVTGGQFVEY